MPLDSKFPSVNVFADPPLGSITGHVSRPGRTRRVSSALGIILVTLLCASGCVRVPQGDAEALDRVAEQFGHKFHFRLERELYLRVRMRSGTIASHEELEEVYRAFFFHPDGGRRESRFVYLNVYDRRGRFVRQLAYDPRSRRMIHGQTEYYY